MGVFDTFAGEGSICQVAGFTFGVLRRSAQVGGIGRAFNLRSKIIGAIRVEDEGGGEGEGEIVGDGDSGCDSSSCKSICVSR